MLAVTSDKRSRFIDDVPSFTELGYPEFTASIWFGLLIKAGTPKEILDPLMKAIAAAHQDPEVKAKLEAQGFDISGQSGEACRAEIEKQTARWAELAKATNFSAD